MFEPFAKAVVRANQVLNEQDKVAKKTAASVAKAEKDKTKSVEAEAKAQVKAWQAADKNVVQAHKAATKEIGLSDKDRAKSAKESADDQMRAWKAADKNVADAHKAALKEASAAEKAEIKERARVAKQVAKEAAAAEKEASRGGAIGRFAGYAARRLAYGAMSYAVSLPGRLAAGMGVDPQDIGSLMQNNVARRSLATDISNVGYIPGTAGPNGQRQSAAGIDAEAMKVATETASDPIKLLEGLHKFVAVTGDLKTGREVMRDMARLSLATGANMEDMVSAAGEMSARLGDIPDKASIIESTMRHLAGMGLKGAVLPEDIAKEMPKLAGLAPMMAGNAADNIGKLFVMLQESRQMGGAGTANQAATMIRGFASASMNGTRLANAISLSQKGGGTMGFRDEAGMLRNPLDIVHDLLRGATDKATGKVDVAAISKVMGGQRGMGAVMGWLNQDLQKGADMGGASGQSKMEAGLQAVADKFRELDEATMSRVQVEENVQAKLADTKQQAQLFNNKLQAIVDKAMPELTTELEKLAPAVLRAVPAIVSMTVALMGFVGWLANSTLGQALGLSEGASTSAPVETNAAYAASTALLTSPTADNLDKAKTELVASQNEAARLGEKVNQERGRLGGRAEYTPGPAGDAFREDEASLRGIIVAIGSLQSTIAKGIPVTETKPVTPKPTLRPTGGPGVHPAARPANDW